MVLSKLCFLNVLSKLMKLMCRDVLHSTDSSMMMYSIAVAVHE